MICVCAASTEEKSVARPVRLEEAVDHRIAAAGRQVQRQALRAERLAQLRETFARSAPRGCRSC